MSWVILMIQVKAGFQCDCKGMVYRYKEGKP